MPIHDDPPPEPGTCTVIVARPGRRDPKADLALLRASERALSLPTGALADTSGMSRPEFRLVEGVSRATADRVANAAVLAGFSPRVREKLGIKRTNQRGSAGFLTILALSMAAWVGGSSLSSGVGELAVLIGSVAAMFAAMAWYLSRLYLPLVVSPQQVFAELDASTGTDVDAPIREARAAVEALRSAVTDGLPEVARQDLAASVEALDHRVSSLAGAARNQARREPAGLAALERRLAAVAARDDADPAEKESLEQAIRDERSAADARERRLAEIVRDLLAVRRSATEALGSLEDRDGWLPTGEGSDAIGQLNRAVEALKDGRAEADPANRLRAAGLRKRQQEG